MVSLFTALVLVAGALQSAPSDRAAAEQMARSGDAAKALAIFHRIVEQDVDDIEARSWAARLALRLGRLAEAEAEFRELLRRHPGDTDAQIGLGATLTRKGEWRQALTVLSEAEHGAGDNPDLFGALARAYRRGGDHGRAMTYFSRARALVPADPDAVDGFEAAARAFGHSVTLEGFGEHASSGSELASGSADAAVRVVPRLHVTAQLRVQSGPGYSDVIRGAGVRWQAGRATVAGGHVLWGPGNAALASSDVSAEAVHYLGRLTAGGNLRVLRYRGIDVLALSPMLMWERDHRWRFDGRYTYSHTRFDSGESAGDHSAVFRSTFRAWRRASVYATYAYGIENFEQLTADRIGSLAATTAAGGFRIELPSLTMVSTTWEHQWRSNDTVIDRVTVSLGQFWP
jgi:tetratricopeptide (TPR) repeat protein